MTENLKANQTGRLQALDAAHHLHPFAEQYGLERDKSRVIVKGEGVWLIDSDGNRILDGMAGLWCVQVGHGRQEIADAVHAQMSQLAYYNTFFKTTHPPAAELAEKVTSLAPDNFNKVFFTSGGSDANDTVFRMVRLYWDLMDRPEKKTIISRWNAYHGSTVAAAALGGMKAMHGQGDVLLPGVHHIDQPYWYDEGGDMDPDAFGIQRARALGEAIDQLGEDKVAAFIAEPVQGAGAVIVPPETYWPEVKRILAERDILFVADEVICGFGRLGHWFGSQHYDLEPDLMPIAKGLSSGYLPIGGVMVSDKVADVMGREGVEFFHGYTYSGHPAACSAALENLRIMQDEKLVERVADDIGPYFRQRWLALGEHPLVGEARAIGLMGALELVSEKPSHRRFDTVGKVGTLCRDNSFANGLVMRAVRDTMIICPPLVISEAEVDELVARVRKTLDDTADALTRAGLMG